jgi:hypothetical protein
MNAIPDQSSFNRNVQPVPASHQAQLTFAAQIFTNMPPKITGWRAADSVDIQNRADHFKTVMGFFRDQYLPKLFGDLNECLPLDNVIPFDDFIQLLREFESDVLGVMQIAIDKADNR